MSRWTWAWCRAGAGRGVQAVECGHRGLILAGDRPKPDGKNRKPEFAGTPYWLAFSGYFSVLREPPAYGEG